MSLGRSVEHARRCYIPILYTASVTKFDCVHDSAGGWNAQELYLWALSRPRESLPSVADDQNADSVSKQGTSKASDGKQHDKASAEKAHNGDSEFISAERGPPQRMNGTADRDHGSTADDRGSGKPWRSAFAKPTQADSPGVAHLRGINGSGRGVRGDGSGRGARPAGHVGSRASEDSSAPPIFNVLAVVPIGLNVCAQV